MAVRAGNDVAVSAASSGVNKETLMDYLRTGAKTRIRMEAGGTVYGDFTAKEHACAEFSDRITVAQAEYEIAANQLIDRVARGGIPQETHTVKSARVVETDEDGQESSSMQVVERTVKSSETLPDWKAAAQRLMFRHPDRYARNRLEVHAGDAPPTEATTISEEEAAQIALDALRAIDTTATEVDG